MAGYLYGVAAECALKAMMDEAGLRPLGSDQRRDDPFYAHFPALKTLLRDVSSSRGASALRKYIENDNFMSQWNTDMRYCKGSDIKAAWIERWREQAKDIVGAIGT